MSCVLTKDFWSHITKNKTARNTLQRAHSSAGICELHLAFATSIKLCRVMDTEILRKVNISAMDYHIQSLGNTFYACGRCRAEIIKKCGQVLTVDYANSIMSGTVSNDILGQNEFAQNVLREFLTLKNRLAAAHIDSIEDIFIMEEDFLDNEFHNKLNIVVSFKNFTMLSYFAWAMKERKSLFHAWNLKDGRSKFWPTIVTKLILQMGKLHHRSENIKIWVMGYSRIVSIEAFTVTPPRFIKVDGPVVLTRVI